jgi:signal transduction histidine kinase
MYAKLRDVLTGTRRGALFSSILLFSLISAADHLLANEISLDVFYFLPISLAAWRGGRAWGNWLSLACTAVWLADSRLLSPEFSAAPHVQLWNAGVRLGAFLVLVELLEGLKSVLARERAVSKLKSSMLHTVSHEFNNALTGISTGLYLLQETEPPAGDPLRPQLYGSIFSSQQKLQLYVKNLLNEARMEDGRFRIEKEALPLRELVENSIAAVDTLLRQKKIELIKVLPDIPVPVYADREALALVVSNLLGNAIKYTPQNGRITVEICPSGDPPGRVIFSVEDTGIGISLEEQKKITSGFYRTAEGKLAADGYGLGLRIANELLALHGSRLEIASEKGKGSSFFFELPAAAAGKGRA